MFPWHVDWPIVLLIALGYLSESPWSRRISLARIRVFCWPTLVDDELASSHGEIRPPGSRSQVLDPSFGSGEEWVHPDGPRFQQPSQLRPEGMWTRIERWIWEAFRS